jgi:hypothetical protein
MILNKKYIIVSSIICLLGLFSCSDDDDAKEEFKKTEVPELILEKSRLNVPVGTSSELNISEGAGEYKVFSSNDSIVQVKSENEKLIVEGIKIGKASVIVSDKNSQVKELYVFSYVENLELKTEISDFKLPVGCEKTITIPITKGNFGYKVKTESEIIYTSIENDNLVLKLLNEGDASFELSDDFGLKEKFDFNIEYTEDPYSDFELEQIKADTNIRHPYEYTDGSYNPKTLIHEVDSENGTITIGWDYWNYYFCKLTFDGDLSVGSKTGGKISAKLGWQDSQNEENLKVEVIKNNGKQCWVVFSFLKEGKLNYGYMCVSVK